MNSNGLTEKEVIEVIKDAAKGNLSAFENIVKNYQYYAYTVAYRVLLDEDDTKDVVQESFVRIWKNLKNYNDNVKFTTWMYKIIINLCYDLLRKRKIDKERMESIDESLIDNLEDIEKTYSNREQAEIIRFISDSLPAKQKMVFVLRDLEGLNTEEVAKILEISLENVKANLSIARKTIRTKLIGWRLTDGM